MKAFILSLIFLFFLPWVIKSQEINKVITDPKLETEIIYGYCDRAGLQEFGDFGPYFKEYYNAYQPDKSEIGKLKRFLKDVDILVVLGTWCDDSREQVPKFFKILDEVRFDETKLTLICVSRNKEAGEINTEQYDIQRVPTFIFSTNGRELGRIIETPMKTLEEDMLIILTE